MFGCSSAAWKLALRNLRLVIDNRGSSSCHGLKSPNICLHLLAIVRRRLPGDWAERSNTTPVLIETFVETPRYTGAVYRASAWSHVGTTQGRGRYDR